MRTTLTALLFALPATLVAADAHAVETYMWGVGPRIGTHFLPAQYPISFPKSVSDDGFIDKVGFDLFAGADAVFYLGPKGRLGVLGGLGFGAQYFDANLVFRYDWVFFTSTIDLFLGGGVGFGSQTMGDKDTDAKLVTSYFPLRVEFGGMIPDRTRAYQLQIFASYNIPATQDYTDATGVDVDATWGFWLNAGIELTVYFGDFIPPGAKSSSKKSSSKSATKKKGASI